jgi:excisionase family DNA binding protein
MIEQGFLTPRELAKLIRFSEVGVRRLIETRRIGFVRLGRRILIPRGEVQRLAELGFTPALPQRSGR